MPGKIFLAVVFIALLVFLSGCIQPPGPIACTLDAKICPDGSAVGRDASNNCEFFPCQETPEFCTKELKICPGGTGVGRNPDNNCEFDPCPQPSEKEARVFTQPVQCSGNPWDNYVADLSEEQAIKLYYSNEYEIEILDFLGIPPAPNTVVCEACSCPRGDTVMVFIKEKDVQEMVSLGWRQT